jgi:hypothetical protein
MLGPCAIARTVRLLIRVRVLEPKSPVCFAPTVAIALQAVLPAAISGAYACNRCLLDPLDAA